MSDLHIVPTGASPFDTIVRLDGDRQYWQGRELMSLLGYAKWQKFCDAIERAIAACKNAGNLVSENFLPEGVKTLGRPQQDYKLSRYACYLVAMNGDPRKPEIAQAQTYFATKTREAETQQTQVSPKTTAEMLVVYAQQLVDQEQRMTDAEQRISAIEQRSIDAAEELHQLPPSKEPAPPLTERDSLRQLVNKWCDATKVHQQIAWRKLYSELYYRDGFNVNSRMKKGEYKTKLDLIADCGKIGDLYA